MGHCLVLYQCISVSWVQSQCQTNPNCLPPFTFSKSVDSLNNDGMYLNTLLILIIQYLIPVVSSRMKSWFCDVTLIALLNYQKDALKKQPALSMLSHSVPSVIREKCSSIKRGKVKGSLLPGDTAGSWFKLVENKW